MLTRLRKFTEERDQGFTLIELLVVIIIIGILAAIAIPVFLNQRKKGVDASLKSDLKNMATAQETYITDNPTKLGAATTDSGVTYNDASTTSTTGTAIPAASAPVFKKSTGNAITVKVTSAGYCIKGDNPGDSGTGFMYYDSSRGGLLGFKADDATAGGTCV